MIRAFIAIPIPETIRSQLVVSQYLLPIARPLPPENFHLTLAFLGSAPENQLEELHFALEQITAPALELQIDGLGVFGGNKPRSVHATFRPDPALNRLQARIARAADMTGFARETRRFTPHVTLGRFAPDEGSAGALAQAIGQIGALNIPPFRADHFTLMRSILRPDGAVHDELARYPLGG
ncbi:RNA 2',3'-cyclic phosphodiesterase [Pararhodobacter sp.]|uniref:RNA 2',3'-cyclic phosphodiesterase n=1 Tax=Pararhodobacter sp. TaxID=2127056 RepID=UPI002FDCBD63